MTMKKHLSLLSTAVMLALSTSASAVAITDAEGDQEIPGNQEYSRVIVSSGNTLTFIDADLITQIFQPPYVKLQRVAEKS